MNIHTTTPTITDDPRLAMLCEFDDAARQAALPCIKRMVTIANLVRTRGVLALDEYSQTLPEDDFFLRTGLELICDGTMPDIVYNILRNLIYSAHKSPTPALLKCMIEIDGVLMIQAGYNPRAIEMQLLAMLGERFCKESPGFLNAAVLSDDPIYDIAVIESDVGRLVSGLLAKMNDRDLQAILLREVSVPDLCVGMMGLDVAVRKRIIGGISGGFRNKLIEELIAYAKAPGAAAIAQALENIRAVIFRVQNITHVGEVVRSESA